MRGGAVHATYSASGQYWREYSYPHTHADAVNASFHDIYFLASETSDQPISVAVANGDIFQLQIGSSTEVIDIGESSLSADVQAKLNATGGVTYFSITPSSTRLSRTTVGATRNVGVTAIPANDYADNLSANKFDMVAGVYDCYFTFDVYAATSGGAHAVANNRWNVVFGLSGTGVRSWQSTNDYVRAVSLQDGVYGKSPRHVRMYLENDASGVNFNLAFTGQSDAFVEVEGIDCFAN